MAIADVAVPVSGKRIALFDVLRGVAIVAMVIYHFAWDLWDFRLISVDVGDDFAWRMFAHAIATTFLALVGISLVLAARNGLRWGAFFRRVALIAGGAVLVSIATWFTDPQTFVYFGILHLIAVASLLAVPFLTLPVWVTAAAGVLVIAIGNLVASPLFDAPWLVWTGLWPNVPQTVDYYPVFPWFGIVLLGIVAARLLVASGQDLALARWRTSDPLTASLALAGRWSLVIYLLHQVVLFEGVALAATFLPPHPPPTAARTDAAQAFMADCLPACGRGGKDAPTCTTSCSCLFAGLTSADLIALSPADFTDDQRTRFDAVVRQCATVNVR